MRIHPALVSCSLCCGLCAQRGPEVEPNNSSAQAQAVALGSQLDATLVAGEQDWFSFATTGGNVRLFAHGPTDLDTVFELRDAAGTTVLAVNDDSSGYFSSITCNLAAGTYTLKVTGWSPATAGSYELEIGQIGTIPATGVESEPNGTLAQANPIAGGDSIDASLASVADQDWYRITLTAPRTGLWFLIGEGQAPWVGSHRWEIYDAAGVLLAPTSTLGSNAGNSSGTEIRSSQIRCWPAGTYHLVVKNSTAPSALGLLVPQGNYRLRLCTMPMGQGAITAEVEPNNSVATATPMNLGGRASGTITNSAGADGNDVYGPFVFGTASVLQYQTMQGTTGALLDSTVRLLAEDGTPLVTSTVGNTLTTTSHARATVSFSLAPATYFVEVLSPGTNPAQAGSYFFEIGASEAPFVVASYSLGDVNSACLGSNSLRPTLSVDSPGESPVLGTNLSRKVGMLPPFAPFFLIEGLSDEFANGVIPLPYDLGPLGAPNCTLNVDPVSNVLYLGSASGEVVLNATQANSIVFRGLPIYEQVIVLDLAANALGLTGSNYARRLFGERHF
jgi:hypothetical protein